eukprot:scaffold108519_cov78-Phaeocystis_antarctica.AAC.6
MDLCEGVACWRCAPARPRAREEMPAAGLLPAGSAPPKSTAHRTSLTTAPARRGRPRARGARARG